MLGFCVAVGATVVFLVVVVVTGLRGRITVHIPCVAATLGSLGVAIYFALELGTVYDLDAAGAITPVHKTIAKLATASYLLPLVTGVRTLSSRTRRKAHFVAAMIALSLTALATVTGTWMLLEAPPIAAPAGDAPAGPGDTGDPGDPGDTGDKDG